MGRKPGRSTTGPGGPAATGARHDDRSDTEDSARAGSDVSARAATRRRSHGLPCGAARHGPAGAGDLEMTEDLWSKVDAYIAEQLVKTDSALDRALETSAAAGLPAINVSPNHGKLLHI